jgi:hypothetical protein
MPNYGRWLPGSEAFGGTTQVTPYPVRLGTTCLDAGPAGQKPGSVTEYDPPRHIAFHHTMLLKKGPFTADIDVHIRYTIRTSRSRDIRHSRSGAQHTDTWLTETGGTIGRLRIPQGECADTGGAEEIRGSAATAFLNRTTSLPSSGQADGDLPRLSS